AARLCPGERARLTGVRHPTEGLGGTGGGQLARGRTRTGERRPGGMIRAARSGVGGLVSRSLLGIVGHGVCLLTLAYQLRDGY
ncbi:hypothetical protein, partial [Streptomyces sp. NPDC003667]